MSSAIERRLAAIEQLLAAGAPGDSIIPTFQTIDAAGQVGAVFPGGLSVPASDLAAPVDTRRIKWYRLADGSVLAQDYTFDKAIDADPTHNEITRQITANPDSLPVNSSAVLLMALNPGGLIAQLRAQAAAGNTLLSVQAGGFSKKVLDDAGASDYVLRGKVAGANANINADQTVPSATWTTINFKGADNWDYGNCHDPAANNGQRFVAPVPGLYAFDAWVGMDGGPSGAGAYRIMDVAASTGLGEFQDAYPISTTAFVRAGATAIFDLAAGDYCFAQTYQDSGANHTVKFGGATFAMVQRG